MIESPLKLIAAIRFQLDQLNSQNAHHEFEHLCRHFSRAAITPNILPATGPVAAGGDQGRDFESFTTFLTNTKSSSRFFFGYGESKPLVFACSLEKRPKVRAKIESDVIEICNSSRPYIIYFFSNQDIPVALRHKLIKWCWDQVQVKLEILDGQALAEQLSAATLFWIAEHYLHISSDLYPPILAPSGGGIRYDEARRRWLYAKNEPSNHADFMELKLGLRRATFRPNLKSDLSRWMNVMESFLHHPDEELQRRAVYELCVAQLRGFHDLNPREELVKLYFNRWASWTQPNALRDATILLSYCSSATLHGEFSVDRAVLRSWSLSLVKRIDEQLTNATGSNARAELLLIRSQAAHLPFRKSIEPLVDLDEVFKWWRRVVDAAKKAPLFPLEDFADLLTSVVRVAGTDQRFIELSRKVDNLLEGRSKGYLVAEKSRDRAIEFIKNGHVLAGIAELHRAKVNWFTAETMTESMLTLLTLSNAYLDVGLCYAAKYHALGAARAIFANSAEDLKRLLPDAIFQLANCEYAAGEWIGFAELVPLFLSAHYQYEANPDDWASHGKIQTIVGHFLVAKSIAKTFGGSELLARVEAPLRSWKMPKELQEEILNPPFSLSQYEGMTPAEVTAKCVEELWGLPFSDCRKPLIYRWRALGVTWEAECDGTLDTVPFAEEFIAVLQITIADLALPDLQLLPTKVHLKVQVERVDRFSVSELPNNKAIAFGIVVPRSTANSNTDLQKTQAEVLAIATSILVACSSLPDVEIGKRVEPAFKNGLSAKAFLVRPYSELFMEFVSPSEFDAARAAIINHNPEFSPREHPELSWKRGPGFGYSKVKARGFLVNRYRRTLAAIPITLKNLTRSDRFQAWVAAQRKNGLLDWEILNLVTNAVLSFRARQTLGQFTPEAYDRSMRELLNHEETEADPPFSEDDLYAADIEFAPKANLLANAQTWGLVNRGPTPDFGAWRRMLDERYFQREDDIEHEDPFALV